MKVLIVGGGGREHALAWYLKRETPACEIVAAPGNPGIASLGRCVPVKATDVDALVALAESERPTFTLVGPEAPLALGIVDRFRERGLPIFGPTRAAAQLETSKAFAKELMLRAGVPTAKATRHIDANDAKRAARALGAPVVIKASGLAAGKGVVVAQTLGEAERAIDDMLVDNVYGEAGAEVLVEEFMEGEELSCFYLTDAYTAIPLVPAQDHKRLLAGDDGPNTGGMGAYAPSMVSRAVADADVTYDPMQQAISVIRPIVTPTLRAMREAQIPFTGLLYVGLMITADGPKVIEFNCRFGDPETQAVLAFMAETGADLTTIMLAVARGEPLPDQWAFRIPRRSVVTTVLAAAGYPDAPRTGDAITLPTDLPDGVTIFHAGTALNAEGQLVTAGGRVLAVTAVADTFERAQTLSRQVAEQIHFDGKQYRADIGWREAERVARAAGN